MQQLLSPKTKKIVAVAGLLALVSVFAFAPRFGGVRLVVATGVADAYEQQILYCEIYQWNNVTNKWVLMANVTHASYTGGYEVDVQPDRNIRFFVKGGVNSKFAGSEAEALLYSRCYITITSELTKTLMTDDNCTGQVGSGAESLYAVWSHYYWSPSGVKPIAGETYSVIFNFEVYYDPDDYS